MVEVEDEVDVRPGADGEDEVRPGAYGDDDVDVVVPSVLEHSHLSENCNVVGDSM